MTRALPALAQQEALFVGEGASLPARIRIRDLPEDKLPRSTGVPFAEGWSGPRLSPDEIAAVAERMAGAGRATETAEEFAPQDPSAADELSR